MANKRQRKKNLKKQHQYKSNTSAKSFTNTQRRHGWQVSTAYTDNVDLVKEANRILDRLAFEMMFAPHRDFYDVTPAELLKITRTFETQYNQKLAPFIRKAVMQLEYKRLLGKILDTYCNTTNVSEFEYLMFNTLPRLLKSKNVKKRQNEFLAVAYTDLGFKEGELYG